MNILIFLHEYSGSNSKVKNSIRQNHGDISIYQNKGVIVREIDLEFGGRRFNSFSRLLLRTESLNWNDAARRYREKNSRMPRDKFLDGAIGPENANYLCPSSSSAVPEGCFPPFLALSLRENHESTISMKQIKCVLIFW